MVVDEGFQKLNQRQNRDETRKYQYHVCLPSLPGKKLAHSTCTHEAGIRNSFPTRGL